MSPLAVWKPKALALLRRVDERPSRERLLLCAAAAALAFLCIDALLFGPALKAWQTAKRQQSAAQISVARLQAEAARRLTETGQRQHQLQAELASWRQRVREGEEALRSHEATLVGPEQMLPLLDHMLARHGQLKLRSMHSLGRTDLLATESPAVSGGAGTLAAATTAVTTAAAKVASPASGPVSGPASSLPAGPAVAPSATGPSLYRHGVELTVEGSFADLLAYVQALEAMPQRVLWGNVGFKVAQYPRAALTLQLYTISRDRHWLEI